MINAIRSIGLTAKGFVYCLIGILTALTAFNMGGKKTGKSGVINFLQKQPFGKVILIVLAAGLLAFALWRLYSAIVDPKGKKNDDASGIGQRIGYGITGLTYLAFSVGIFLSALSWGSSGGGGEKHYLSALMQKPYGPIVIGAIGVVIICVGLYQVYWGYSKKYLQRLDYSEGHPPEFLKKTGLFGNIALGLVFALIGFFYLSAAYTHNIQMVSGTKGAFAFLQQQEYGTILMACIAVGVFFYGTFTLLLAKYSSVATD